jgi:hypothetical protein
MVRGVYTRGWRTGSAAGVGWVGSVRVAVAGRQGGKAKRVPPRLGDHLSCGPFDNARKSAGRSIITPRHGCIFSRCLSPETTTDALHCAERDGDNELAAELRARECGDMAAWLAASGFHKRSSPTGVGGNDTLIADQFAAIDEHVSALAMRNDLAVLSSNHSLQLSKGDKLDAIDGL